MMWDKSGFTYVNTKIINNKILFLTINQNRYKQTPLHSIKNSSLVIKIQINQGVYDYLPMESIADDQIFLDYRMDRNKQHMSEHPDEQPHSITKYHQPNYYTVHNTNIPRFQKIEQCDWEQYTITAIGYIN